MGENGLRTAADEVAVLEDDIAPLHAFEPFSAEFRSLDRQDGITHFFAAKRGILEIGEDLAEARDVWFAYRTSAKRIQNGATCRSCEAVQRTVCLIVVCACLANIKCTVRRQLLQ